MNEFDSGAYDEPSLNDPSITLGESILIRFGFTFGKDGETFTFVWAGYGILFLLISSVAFATLTAFFFNRIRFATGKALVTEETEEGGNEGDEVVNDGVVDDIVSPIPFKRANLTFRDIHYTVKSSVSKETLELLKGISGIVEAGKVGRFRRLFPPKGGRSQFDSIPCYFFALRR